MKKHWIYMALPIAIIGSCIELQQYLESDDIVIDRFPKSANTVIKQNIENLLSQLVPKDIAPKENSNSSLETSVNETTAEAAVKEAAFSGSVVSIAASEKARAEDITEAEIDAMVRSVTGDLDTVIQNRQTVVLKPNLVQMMVDSTGELLDVEVNGITTDWRLTKAVLRRVRELNPDGNVYIMEGVASGQTRKVMEHFHYTDEYLKGVTGFISLEEDCGSWRDFDAPEVVKVDLPEGLLHQTYYFNRILYEADVIISLPVLKTSSGVVVTGSIKNFSIGTPPGNLYGMAPGTPSKRNMVSHKITDGELDKWIYDYFTAKPVNYVVVDGLQGFQSGPIPMSSERKDSDKMNMRVILSGKDSVAVDTVCSLITGWDPESVGYLNLFREHESRGGVDNILVKGGYVDELRKNFTVYSPGLGGVRLENLPGPDFTAAAKWDGERITISYQADKAACKMEIYVDGIFQYSGSVGTGDSLSLEIPGLSGQNRELELVVYDRYLNKNVKRVELIKSKPELKTLPD